MKRIKKVVFLLVALMMAMEVSIGTQAVDVAAATSPTTAYNKYMSHYLYNKDNYPNGRYQIRDLDKDGTPELFFRYTTANGCGYKVYTYRAKKGVILVQNIKSNGRSMSVYGKTLRVVVSKGNTTTVTYYRLNSRRMLKLSEYRKVVNPSGGVSYYDISGKAISSAKYQEKAIANGVDYADMFYKGKKVK